MISRGCIRIGLVVLLLTGIAGLTLVSSPAPTHGALVPPTPTNEPRPGGNPDRSQPLGPPSATVSGFVYNYSEAAYQPGVTVVLSGGGWRVETVTDSNGFYQFGNLGIGSAVLNLQLPPGGHSVTPDWPVTLESGSHIKVNLGFYMWDAPPPIPVILSGALSNNTLIVKVRNNTTETATGGQLEIILPEQLSKIQPPVVSQGMLDTTDNRVVVTVGDLAADQELILNVPLVRKVAAAAPPAETIQVAFTYDQQLTPQRVLIDSASVSTQPGPAKPAQPPLAAPGAAAAKPEVGAQAAPPVSGPVSAQEEPSVTIAEEPAAVPITGGAESAANVVTILLPALLVVGLGVAGWRALRPRS